MFLPSESGCFTDPTTGLVLMGARWYDPGTGRSLTRDPSDYNGGMNLYSYCGGNPVNRSDPSGLDWLDDASNFSYGMGGVISCGLTNKIDDALGVGDVIDKNSTAYHAGVYSGYGYVAVSTVVDGVGLVQGGMRAYRVASGFRATVSAAEDAAPVAMVVTNGIRGRAFEATVIAALGGRLPSAVRTGTTLAGAAINTIPDLEDANTVTEIKDVANLSYSRQLQAQIEYATGVGKSYRLIVNTATHVSQPLVDAVRDAGGTI